MTAICDQIVGGIPVPPSFVKFVKLWGELVRALTMPKRRSSARSPKLWAAARLGESHRLAFIAKSSLHIPGKQRRNQRLSEFKLSLRS